MENFETISRDFRQFFNYQDLTQLIEGKADKQTLFSIGEDKASNRYVQELEQSIGDQANKLKHLSVFASELADSLLPSGEIGIKVDDNNANKIGARQSLI